MLMPKRTKYRKAHRGRMTGRRVAGTSIAFGEYALQALEPKWLTSQQIEASRRAVMHFLKRGGEAGVATFPPPPHKRGGRKARAETRMGSGKGNPGLGVAVVRRGRILFELGGVPPAAA